jgi:hypothetical protein
MCPDFLHPNLHEHQIKKPQLIDKQQTEAFPSGGEGITSLNARLSGWERIESICAAALRACIFIPVRFRKQACPLPEIKMPRSFQERGTN